jgi:hypothetical protein
VNGDLRFLLYPTRRQQVGIGGFVVGVFKVIDLDPAAIDQRFEAVVGLAEADAQLLCEFALRDLGVALDLAEDSQMDFLVGGQVIGPASAVSFSSDGSRISLRSSGMTIQKARYRPAVPFRAPHKA